MLVPTAPVRLRWVRLFATYLDAPTSELHVIGTTGAEIIAPGGSPIQRGGGGIHGTCDCDSQCYIFRTGTTSGTRHCHYVAPEVFIQKPDMLQCRF